MNSEWVATIDPNILEIRESNLVTLSNTMVSYRLMKKKTGELVLQGAYQIFSGKTCSLEWQDIETVEE